MQSNAKQCKAKQCKAMESNAKQCKAMQSNAKQCHANAKQCKTKQSNANQHKAMQSKTIKRPGSLKRTRCFKALRPGVALTRASFVSGFRQSLHPRVVEQ